MYLKKSRIERRYSKRAACPGVLYVDGVLERGVATKSVAFRWDDREEMALARRGRRG